MRQKLIVRPEELILPTFDIKTKNLPRENFDKQLDAIAAKGCMTFQPQNFIISSYNRSQYGHNQSEKK